jgi:peptidoglycan/xylan/chitin deacetylase (PgdA/CDA1 family)
VQRLPPIVLAYHSVNRVAREHDPRSLVVSPSRFRLQVETLFARGYEFAKVTDFAERLRTSGPPAGVCAVTFDDGSADSVLIDVLRELDVPGTLFICPGLLGQPHPWLRRESGVRLMSADALREVANLPFVEIGSHTNTHADLSAATEDEAYRELSSSRQALEDLLNIRVTSLAYPFCHYSAACPRAARRAGYTCAVTCEGRGGWLPFELRREAIASWDGGLSFALKSRGGAHLFHRSHVGQWALRLRRGVADRKLRAK